MGPATALESTSETLQFPKLNGTNYHVWADNMKAALQAKSLWGVISSCECCPPKPPLNPPKPHVSESSVPVLTEAVTAASTEGAKGKLKEDLDAELFEMFQSKEYRAWELAVERYEQWLNKLLWGLCKAPSSFLNGSLLLTLSVLNRCGIISMIHMWTSKAG